LNYSLQPQRPNCEDSMSLKDVILDTVGVAPSDPTWERAAMIDKLRSARQAFDEQHPDQPGGRWITRDGDDRVAFAPTRPDGQQLVIGGQAVSFWHPDELPAVLDAFEAAIVSGELDPQLTGSTPAGHSLPLARITPA
jgi:hypothetical protein